MPNEQTETPTLSPDHPSDTPRISIAAGIGITAVVVIGFILSYTAGYFTARRPAPSQGVALPTPNPTQAAAKRQAANKPIECGDLECLQSDAEGVYGYARLTGYYRQYDGTQWQWNNAPATCDSIIPTGGSKALLSDFVNLISRGNALNKNIDGKLHININLYDLTAPEKALLLSSSESRQIELHVIRPVPPGRGASTCESYLTILKVSPKPELPEQ